MAVWQPITGDLPQYTVGGAQAAAYVLKFYEIGTTTPLTVSSTSAGTPTTTDFLLDSEGYTTLSSTRVVPHVQTAYKLIMYLNQTDADADDTGSAVWTIDNLSVTTETSVIASNVTALAAIDVTEFTSAYLEGTSAIDDGGQSHFYYDAASAAVENGTTVVTPDSVGAGAGRWLILNVETLALGDDSVTTAKILNDAVTTAKILNDNVTTAKILDDNVTYAKIQNIAGDNKLLGNTTGTDQVVQEVTVETAMIDNDAVTYAKMQDIVSDNVLLGNTTGANQTVQEVTVETAMIDNEAITFAKMQNINTNRLLGRDTASIGSPEEILLDDSTIELNGSGTLQVKALGIDTAEIATDAVRQGEIKTSTWSDDTLSTGTVTTGEIGVDSVTNTGGAYTLGISGTITGMGTGELAWLTNGCANGGNLADGYHFGLCCFNDSNSSDATALVDGVYVSSSPPYNMGHGDVAHFMFIRVAADGTVLGTHQSSTPPWAYNGPTNITPDRTEKLGEKGKDESDINYAIRMGASDHVERLKKFKNVPKKIILPPSQGGDLDEWLAPREMMEVEIDHEMKNRDMGLIPHPFAMLKEGERVFLADPCSAITDTLAEVHKRGEYREIQAMYKTGYIKIGDKVTGLKASAKPRGVEVRKISWKSS